MNCNNCLGREIYQIIYLMLYNIVNRSHSIFSRKFHLISYTSSLLNKAFYQFSNKSDLEKISKNPNTIDNFIPEINKPRQKGGGLQSVQRVINRQQAGQQLKMRIEDLKSRHEVLRKELMAKVNIPFLLCGINRKTFHQSYSYLPQRVMSYYKIHPSVITDYLLKIYKASLYSIVDNNETFMNQYWEAGFKDKVLKSLDAAKEKGYTLKITEEKRFADQLKESCKISDAIMLRGLSIRRNQNQHPSQYVKYAEDKDFGLVTYTPKYLTADNQKFSDPQSNKTVYKGYEKMILRVLLLIKTPLRLTIPQITVSDQLNTFQHLVIMQNQMIAPPFLQSRYKLQTLVEWLGKYRFGEWRVIDIDNFMKGNSPFRDHEVQVQLQQVFKDTILDKSYFCNIRNI